MYRKEKRMKRTNTMKGANTNNVGSLLDKQTWEIEQRPKPTKGCCANSCVIHSPTVFVPLTQNKGKIIGFKTLSFFFI